MRMSRIVIRNFTRQPLTRRISGLCGGTGVTTYAENIGVMNLTRNFSSTVCVVAGMFAIVFGLCPKFGALI